jgi:hypothetical protein
VWVLNKTDVSSEKTCSHQNPMLLSGVCSEKKVSTGQKGSREIPSSLEGNTGAQKEIASQFDSGKIANCMAGL